MGQISSLFVRKVLAAAADSIYKPPFLRTLDLDPDSTVDATRMVSATDYYSFFGALAKQDSEGVSLPLRAGNSMSCEDYGAFGLAWKSAANLRGSFERASRYALVLTSVSNYEVVPASQGAMIVLHREGERKLGMRLSNEATIASISSISQEVFQGDFRPQEVYFKHSAPGTTSFHEEYFGCEVHFDSDYDGLLVSKEDLIQPNKLADQSFLEFFESHLESTIKEIEYEESLEQEITNRISQMLSEGVPTVNEVALHFRMSERTLQRRLFDSGVTYRSLVDLARKQLSRQLLRETEYSLAEVAFMTGFSEQSAFTRAFKRWEGETPRSYRISMPTTSRE